MRLARFGAALLALGVVCASAARADDKTALIETRQSGQDVIYGLIASMKATVAAKGDVKPFADGADAMARWFKQFPTLFPAGTETGHNTKVKPEAFSDSAGFAKASLAASDAAAALSAAAKSGDQAAFVEKFKALGESCGACHRAYKERS